ncbi:MAG: ComEC/Rec2 family competence protein [Acidobacteria bacterium]|nr:ComEC/Rec2 family competence protein [Acidobacteriota bacterium]
MPTPKVSQFANAPMLWLAICFALGIGAAAYLPLGSVVLTSLCLAFAAASFVFRKHPFATVLIFAAFVFAGSVAQCASENSISPDRIRRLYDEQRIPFGESVEITGVVRGSVEVTPDSFFALIDAESVVLAGQPQNASGRIRVFSPSSEAEQESIQDLRDGTRIRFSCELKRDDEFRNPGGLSRRKVLEWQGMDATCSVKTPLSITIIGQPDVFSPKTSVFSFRERLIAEFREMFSPQVSGVMIASLLGNKHFLDKQTADIFREGGTFHILVISGLHITFIGGLAALFVGLFTKRKIVQFVIVCTFLWLYTLAVGADIPVVRASLMFTVLWFSFVIHRSGSLANAFGTCGLVLLAWRPNDLFSPSFQLTFVSVGAIVIAAFPLIKTLREIGTWTPTRTQPFPANVPGWYQRVCETLYWNEKVWDIESGRNVWSAKLFKHPFLPSIVGVRLQKVIAYLFEGILVSAIVQTAMLPLTVHYFHRVTPASIPLNLWTGVLIAIESFASLFAIFFSYINELLALPFIRVAELIHRLMVFPGEFLDRGWLSFRVPVYAGVEFELYAFYILLVSFVGLAAYVWDPFAVRPKASVFNRTTLALAGTMMATAAMIIVFHPFSSPRADGRLYVEFLDVGQGDSIFVTFPNGETMLIDGGGRRSFDDGEETFKPDSPSIGEMVVSEFLWQKGYSRVDRIVATHADADHIQGLTDVARNFGVGEAWLGNSESDDSDQARLIEVLNANKTPTKVVARGDRFDIGGVAVEILNPPNSTLITTSENDRSVVIRLVFGEREFLLTGDAERAVETELLNETDLRADVVKVPHHGSKTSSTEAFVNATQARFAVIPVGRRSPFHHPNKDVVERWLNTGAIVMTTGEYGTIRFSTDGQVLSVGSFVPK